MDFLTSFLKQQNYQSDILNQTQIIKVVFDKTSNRLDLSLKLLKVLKPDLLRVFIKDLKKYLLNNGFNCELFLSFTYDEIGRAHV
jgi:hypothetical protein